MRALLPTFAFVLMIVTSSCSGGGGGGDPDGGIATANDDKSSKADCDKIAADIRNAATQRGLPPEGVCASTDPNVVAAFKEACKALKECNDRCCK